MNRLIDKLIILIVSLFAMYQTLDGYPFLVLFYLSIAISALNYYLLDRERTDNRMSPEGVKEWMAFALEIIIGMMVFVHPPVAFIIPILMYDIAHSRNYIALVISFAGLCTIIDTYDIPVLLFLVVMSLLALVMSIRTERDLVLKENYKHLRDDSSEKNARLRSQNQELMYARDNEVYNAQLAERNRIAREIHDNVGHTLSRAILQMGALLAIHKEEPVHSELEGVRQTLDSAMTSIRSSVHDLHDESIDVAASMKQMSDSLSEHFDVNLDIDIGDDMPRPVKYACIGITKECISNIIKHSKNSHVDIRLSEHPSMYQLIVHDYEPDPKNAYPDDKKNASQDNGQKRKTMDDKTDVGMGLENIRTRAESVNGSLNISTENGFRVFVSIPR